MLFTDSDYEGEYLPFRNDDWSSYDRASPGTYLQRNGAAVQGESVHEAQTSDHFGPLPNGDGVAGVNVVVVSIGELLLSERHWLHVADDRPDCVDCSDLQATSTGADNVG